MHSEFMREAFSQSNKEAGQPSLEELRTTALTKLREAYLDLTYIPDDIEKSKKKRPLDNAHC